MNFIWQTALLVFVPVFTFFIGAGAAYKWGADASNAKNILHIDALKIENARLRFQIKMLETQLAVMFNHSGIRPRATTAHGWRGVLGLKDGNVTRDQIMKAYRDRAKVLHPDKGGSVADMAILNLAKDAALKEVR